MPTNTFTNSLLDGASGGISRLAAALGGGQNAYQDSYDKAATAQSRIAQALAAIGNQNADARLRDAQAGEVTAKTNVLGQRPGLFNEQVANAAGADVPTVNAYRAQLRGGAPATVPMGPPTEAGAMGATPLPAPVATKIGAALQQFLPLLTNTGDLKPDDLAAAANTFRNMGLSDRVIADPSLRNTVAGAQAAVAAKPLYNAGADGAVLDQYGGGLDTANPMAGATIKLRGAQAADATAGAAAHYAQADASRASAAQTRQNIADGIKTGDIVVITDNDGNTSLLNKRTGISRPATSADGVPLIGKSSNGNLKPIPPQVNSKIIEGKQGLTNIDEAIAALQADPGALGWTNGIPGSQTVKQMWASPQDIATRAQVANIGSLVLHDRSGAAVSASEFPRLAPFIPSPSDSPKSAVTKLQRMKQIAEQELGLYAGTYNEDNGYRSSPILAPAASPPAPATGGWKYLGKE